MSRDDEKNPDKPAYPTDIHYERPNKYHTGLTKRELFAMAAMQGILASSADRGDQAVAKMSVKFADALLNELG